MRSKIRQIVGKIEAKVEGFNSVKGQPDQVIKKYGICILDMDKHKRELTDLKCPNKLRSDKESALSDAMEQYVLVNNILLQDTYGNNTLNDLNRC